MPPNSALDPFLPNPDTDDHFVVFSPSEHKMSEGSGYWSNDCGWVPEDGGVTVFSAKERAVFNLPASATGDAQWMPLVELCENDAQRMADYLAAERRASRPRIRPAR